MRLSYSPESVAHLQELRDFVEARSSATVADSFLDSLPTFCEGLATFPARGRVRDDIRPGLRVVSFRKRTVIAFAALGDDLLIIDVFHGGRDYEAILSNPPDIERP